MPIGQRCREKSSCSETLCLKPPIGSVTDCMDSYIAAVSTILMTGGGGNMFRRGFVWVKALRSLSFT